MCARPSCPFQPVPGRQYCRLHQHSERARRPQTDNPRQTQNLVSQVAARRRRETAARAAQERQDAMEYARLLVKFGPPPAPPPPPPTPVIPPEPMDRNLEL